VLLDGYKRHVLRDLDTGLVTPWYDSRQHAGSDVTGDIAAGLDAVGLTRRICTSTVPAYRASGMVRRRAGDLAVHRKAWPERKTAGARQGSVHIDFAAGQLTARRRDHAIRARQDRTLPQHTPVRPAGDVTDAYTDTYYDHYGSGRREAFSDPKYPPRGGWYKAHVAQREVMEPFKAARRWLSAQPEPSTP
jgi:hypothetical protein